MNWGITQKWVMTVAPLYTMLTKQIFCVVSFVKKKKRKRSLYLGQPAPFEENDHHFHERPAHTLTLTPVYFHGRPAHTYSKWSIFRGDLPTHSH